MIISMHPGANGSVEVVENFLEGRGFQSERIRGAERSVIGVIGGNIPSELQEQIEQLPGVAQVVRISRPYKLASREWKPESTVITVDGVSIGGREICVIAGPCSVEGPEAIVDHARLAKELGGQILRGGAYKPRTSPYSFQGYEREGLKMLAEARRQTGLPVITEVMDPRDVEAVCEYADILQIGARNCQNFSLLKEVGRARKPAMLKRGMSCTVEDWLMAAEYIMAGGNYEVMLCERGIRTFETSTRNTTDLNAVAVAKQLSHLPVIVDPSHSTGKRSLVVALARAAVAVGADGLILEVHPNPDRAMSDGAQTIDPREFRRLMQECAAIANAIGRHIPMPSMYHAPAWTLPD